MTEKKGKEFIEWLEKEIDTLTKENRHHKAEKDDKKLIKNLATIETYFKVLKRYRLLVYSEQ